MSTGRNEGRNEGRKMGVALYRSASLLADAGVQFILPNIPACPTPSLKRKSGLGTAFVILFSAKFLTHFDAETAPISSLFLPRGQCAVRLSQCQCRRRQWRTRTKRDLGGAERSEKSRGGKTRSRSKFSSFLLEEAN